MIRGLVIREAEEADYPAIGKLLDEAFGGNAESRLVVQLRQDHDAVLELVAAHELEVVGHLLFSRLRVEGDDGRSVDALALAPLAVQPKRQRTGVGTALMENAQKLLEARDETLCVVLGEPAYYGRFGYGRERAAGFACEYQGEYLQALAWGEAPAAGKLVYPQAFSNL